MTLSVIVLIRESELVDFSESDVEAVGVGVDVVLVDVAASVVELEGNAVDSVALESCCAAVASNVSWDSTSKYAYAGTCNPAGIGLGYPVNTGKQFVAHSLHVIIVLFWHRAHALIKEYTTVLHWHGFTASMVGPRYTVLLGKAATL